ncbi:recombinase family protein [Phormidium sp. FACHB-592]|uniref:Recombinase family protein n=1 Tax=Stenomitos frigidus AS-A4 TaxID=2933935 RepID=A0ABV0KEY2_9CYAN|nr:recombinase family protein [Phormidium sp. FACHB-592]MBD2076367.1 recombinase family protein [Phormidium sp. FACHB-592]
MGLQSLAIVDYEQLKRTPLSGRLGAKLFERMRVARCVRVSTIEQSRSGQSIERQRFVVDEIAAQLGTLDDALLFQDIISGLKEERETLARIEQLVVAGALDAIVCDRIDRFSRDTETLSRLAKLFQRSGVRFFEAARSADGTARSAEIDWINPNDWKYFVQAGVDAEAESRRIKQRVSRTYRYSRAKGKPNQKAPFGYIRTKETYDRDDAEFKDGITKHQALRQMVEILLRSPFVSDAIDEVNRALGQYWSRSSFLRLIDNPVLRGHTGYRIQKNGKHQELIYNTHPEIAVISPAEWLSIEDKRRQNGRLWGSNSKAKRYSISGLVRCSECGSACEIIPNKGRSGKLYSYVGCGAYRRLDPRFSCGTRRVNGDRSPFAKLEVIESAIIAALATRAETLMSVAVDETAKAIADPEILKLELQIEQLQATIKMVGDDEGWLSRKIEKLVAQIKAKQNATPEVPTDDLSSLVMLGSTPSFWEDYPIEGKRLLFARYVRTVWRDWNAALTVDLWI